MIVAAHHGRGASLPREPFGEFLPGVHNYGTQILARLKRLQHVDILIPERHLLFRHRQNEHGVMMIRPEKADSAMAKLEQMIDSLPNSADHVVVYGVHTKLVGAGVGADVGNVIQYKPLGDFLVDDSVFQKEAVAIPL